MILTVTLNAALDVTYAVPALVPGSTHRVTTVAERAGGKGVNVARVLHALAEPVVATGLAGGATGTRIRALLAAEGVRDAFTAISAESRRTVTVANPATGFWEPGPDVSTAEWTAFLARYRALLHAARVVVLSGSLPPGVPEDAYARLIADARHAEVRSVLDTSGPALRHGLAAGPDLAKPNADELAEAGEARGAREVVASYGAGGLVASTVDGRWRARLPEPLDGNATGAGDACVAALARGMTNRSTWPERLVDAVALSAAAVTAHTAGQIELDHWRRLRPAVTVEEA